jgi:plasmid stabilization system protein ParE
MTPDGPNESAPRVTVLPAAEAEITEAFRWYEDKSEGLGSEFMRALDATLATVQRGPALFAAVHKQVRRAMLRRFPYGVFYLHEGDQIIVIACFHASRDPKQWQDRA